MSDIRYNVSELFQMIFGINSPVFITEPLQKQQTDKIDFSGIQTLPEYYTQEATSWMGTPIIFQGKFDGGTYFKYLEDGRLDTVQMAEFTLPPATMFAFRRAKNVTRTNVLGASGTVKEIYGFDDWIIDVRGLALDEPNRSAQEQINELLKWEQLADSINLSGELFNSHGIFKGMINDWNDSLTQAKAGVVGFSFQLIGDTYFDLI